MEICALTALELRKKLLLVLHKAAVSLKFSHCSAHASLKI